MTDLTAANRLAAAAEECYEEGRWALAVEKFEAASEAYVCATLHTSDTKCVQALRMLALSHAQRAHETRLRINLQHGLHANFGGSKAGGNGAAAADAADAALRPRSASSDQAKASGSGSGTAVSGEALEVYRALARLSSQLISTHEELRFGAEELVRLLSASGPVCSNGTPSSAGGAISGSTLLHSFCVVSSQRGASVAGSTTAPPPPGSQTLQQSVMGVSPITAQSLAGSAEARSAAGSLESEGADGRASIAQLTAENSRLSRENHAFRLKVSEMQAVLAKAQRRAADQLRLVRRALSALREVHGAPRPELAADTAAEIADLRRQLEGAHTVRRQQAELVRKYEQRWAQLKASARRKQQAQQAAAAAQQGAATQPH